MDDKIRELKSFFTSSELSYLVEFDGTEMSLNDFIDNILSKSSEFLNAPINYLVENIRGMKMSLPHDILDDINAMNKEENEKQAKLAEIISRHPEWNDENIIDNGTGKCISFKRFVLSKSLNEFDNDLNVRFGPRFISLDELYEKSRNIINNDEVKPTIADKRQIVEHAYVSALANFQDKRKEIGEVKLANGLTLDEYIHSLVNGITDDFEIDLETLGYTPSTTYDKKNMFNLVFMLVNHANNILEKELEDEITQELKINKAFDKVDDVPEIKTSLVDKDELTDLERESLSRDISKSLPSDVLTTTIEEDILKELQDLSRAIDLNKGDISLEKKFNDLQERIANEVRSEAPFYNRLMAEAYKVSEKIDKAKNIRNGQITKEEDTFEYYSKKIHELELSLDEVKTNEDYAYMKNRIIKLKDEISSYNITNSKIWDLVHDLESALTKKSVIVEFRNEDKKKRVKDELEVLSHTIRFSANNPDNVDILNEKTQELELKLDEYSSILTPGEIDYYMTVINNARNTMTRETNMRAVL